MPDDLPWRATAAGVELRLRLTPKSSKDAVDGLMETAEGPAFKARVRAVPEDSKANVAAARLVADWLGVPPTTVTLAAGAKSRIKTLAIVGDTGKLCTVLADRLAVLDKD